MTPEPPLLSLDQVHKSYPQPIGTADTPVLRGVSLSVRPGESVAIVGPSGSGKSTLLNLMGLLDQPTTGRIFLNGLDATALSERQAAEARNRDIGFVFQLHHLLPQCSVLENVLIPTLPLPAAARAGSEQHAGELLHAAGLGHRLHHRPAELSGGEQLRTAVARALINRPKLLLADEPTGSLDHATANDLTDLLLTLNREQGLALVVVTHSREVADRMQTRRELQDGRLNPA